MRRALVVAIAIAGTSALAARARADTGLSVTVEGCPDLRALEIARLLDVELATVSQRVRADPLRVELSCEQGRLHVVAVDPITDKRLTRDVDLPDRAPERERTVAIIVSQLFVTSWSELLLRPPRDPPASLPPPHAVAPDVARAARAEASDAIEPAWARPSFSLAIGPRARSLSSPILGARFSARPSLLVGDSARLWIDLGYERGSADRVLGAVGYSLASASLGAAWRSSRVGPIRFEIGALAGAAYVDLRGQPTSLAAGSSASGAVAELAIVAGPHFALGALWIGLELAAGLTLPRIAGRVERDNDVMLGGPFVGASLVLGAERGGR